MSFNWIYCTRPSSDVSFNEVENRATQVIISDCVYRGVVINPPHTRDCIVNSSVITRSVLRHLRSSEWDGRTWGTANIDCIEICTQYIVYNSGCYSPIFHWHLIITTTWLGFYRWCIPLTLIFLFSLMIKCFYFWSINTYLVVFRSKLSHLSYWWIPCSISYFNGIEHILPLILNNLVNMPLPPVPLVYIIALASRTSFAGTRLRCWEYLRDLGRQLGWILKEVVVKATSAYLNRWYQL